MVMTSDLSCFRLSIRYSTKDSGRMYTSMEGCSIMFSMTSSLMISGSTPCHALSLRRTLTLVIPLLTPATCTISPWTPCSGGGGGVRCDTKGTTITGETQYIRTQGQHGQRIHWFQFQYSKQCYNNSKKFNNKNKNICTLTLH